MMKRSLLLLKLLNLQRPQRHQSLKPPHKL
jgi:hypothetical protein